MLGRWILGCLRTLEELSFIDVQIHEDTLVASQIDAVGKEKIKVYRLYHRIQRQ